MKQLRIMKQARDQKHPPVTLFKEVGFANTFWRRMRGLLGRASLNEQEGLLIHPCGQVHTVGMRFPIDVIFLNRQGLVLKVVHALKPWRQARARRARYTLELAAGVAQQHKIKLGDTLLWD